MFSKIAIFFIRIYQKTFSSHTGIFKDILYSQPICSHEPHCSQYSKKVFKRYGFIKGIKYTMERINNCNNSITKKYDPPFYKIIFFSSSQIGIPFLDNLYNDERFEIAGITTLPDTPKGRGQKKQPNIIKKHAIEKLFLKKENIKTPLKLKNNENYEKRIEEINPDFFVVLSYGKILPGSILNKPKIGPINIHGSLLPKYRGASPIQSVFLNNEQKSGITIIYMDQGMDTGNIIKTLEINLEKFDNSKTLINKFIKYGPDFFNDALWHFGKGKISSKKQNEQNSTYCQKFTKQDGEINFKENAKTIYNKFQAFYLWPGIYTYLNGKKIEIKDCYFDEKDAGKKIGERFTQNDKIKIQTGLGNLIIKKIKPEGKKTMNVRDFTNGHPEILN